MKHNQIIYSERPRMLTSVCISTFIGSGLLMLISIFLIFINNVQISEFFIRMAERGAYASDMRALLKTFENATYIGVIKLSLSIVSIVGATMMFKLNKGGFYLYVFSQITLLFVSPLINGKFNFSIYAIAFVVIWILLYVKYLSCMTNKSSYCK
ncbi:MAG: hypothetical protein WBG43_02235 [Marinifilaceae bacterium]